MYHRWCGGRFIWHRLTMSLVSLLLCARVPVRACVRVNAPQEVAALIRKGSLEEGVPLTVLRRVATGFTPSSLNTGTPQTADNTSPAVRPSPVPSRGGICSPSVGASPTRSHIPVLRTRLGGAAENRRPSPLVPKAARSIARRFGKKPMTPRRAGGLRTDIGAATPSPARPRVTFVTDEE